MRSWIRRALSKQQLTRQATGRAVRIKEIPPNEKLVLLVEFSMVAVGVLAALEIVHIVYMGTWNAEIFAAITGLIGTITGLFVGAKA